MKALLSSPSTTNQVELLNPNDIAEKLYAYLTAKGIGVGSMTIDKGLSRKESVGIHNVIVAKIQEIRSDLGVTPSVCEKMYTRSWLASEKDNHAIYFSSEPQRNWIENFNKKYNRVYRHNIMSLVFKVFLLENGFINSDLAFNGVYTVVGVPQEDKKSKETYYMDAYRIDVAFAQPNYGDVVVGATTLSKKRFLLKKEVATTSGSGDLGLIASFDESNYHVVRSLDGRKTKNSTFEPFISFGKGTDQEKRERLNREGLGHSLRLRRLFYDFLETCDINYKKKDFVSDHYLDRSDLVKDDFEDPKELCIINNLGSDFGTHEKSLLTAFLFSVLPATQVSFFAEGKCVSTYTKNENVDSDGGRAKATSWDVTEEIPWKSIILNPAKCYLTLNKELHDKGSCLLKQADGLYVGDGNGADDFYALLKERHTFMVDSFVAIQGVNLDKIELQALVKTKGGVQNSCKFGTLPIGKPRMKDVYGSVEDFYSHLEKGFLEKGFDGDFSKDVKFIVSPALKRIASELKLKSFLQQSTEGSHALSAEVFNLVDKSIDGKYAAICTRTQRNKPFVIAVLRFEIEDSRMSKFVVETVSESHSNSSDHLSEVLEEFPFIPLSFDKPRDGVFYLADIERKVYAEAYTSPPYTPYLLGAEGILEGLENNTLVLSKGIKEGLFPCVAFYNSESKGKVIMKNTICLDMSQDIKVPFYIPPYSLPLKLHNNMTVYDYEQKTFEDVSVAPHEAKETPLFKLFFSSFTDDLLKINATSYMTIFNKFCEIVVKN